jgi:hypothetical protein
MWFLAVVDSEPTGVRTVSAPGLTAVVAADDGMPATTELLLRHASVVASLLDQCDAVLPVRGGTRVDTPATIRRLLTDRRDEFRQALGRLRGAVELAVRWEPPPGALTAPATDGRSYLASRAKAWGWVNDTFEQLHALAARPFVSDLRVFGRSPTSIRASLLVDRADAERAKDEVVRAGGATPGSLTCTGPFPPYTFCSASVEAVP